MTSLQWLLQRFVDTRVHRNNTLRVGSAVSGVSPIYRVGAGDHCRFRYFFRSVESVYFPTRRVGVGVRSPFLGFRVRSPPITRLHRTNTLLVGSVVSDNFSIHRVGAGDHCRFRYFFRSVSSSYLILVTRLDLLRTLFCVCPS
jgi:hypothetical protein